MGSFKDLKVWQAGIRLVREVYKVCRELPNYERRSLCDQLRRAAVSVPSNIAEGFSRHNPKEFSHFLLIAKGSLAEVETQLIVCEELEFVKPEQVRHLYPLIESLNRMLYSLVLTQKQPMNTDSRRTNG